MTNVRNLVSRVIPLLGLQSSKESGANREIKIYYHENNRNDDPKKPTVLYVPGFMSTGRATKSNFMAEHCQKINVDYVCYDPEGVVDASKSPESEILSNYESLKFSHWFDDCNTVVEVIKKRSKGPVLLVGSSMGGWIGLKVSLVHPDLIRGLLLIAPSLNFVRPKFKSWLDSMDSETRARLEQGETVVLPTSRGKMPVSKRFADESVEMEIDPSTPLDIDVPVRIIHGAKDDEVPLKNSLDLMSLISSKDIDLTIRKNGDHRMSTDFDLELVGQNLDLLAEKISCG